MGFISWGCTSRLLRLLNVPRMKFFVYWVWVVTDDPFWKVVSYTVDWNCIPAVIVFPRTDSGGYQSNSM